MRRLAWLHYVAVCTTVFIACAPSSYSDRPVELLLRPRNATIDDQSTIALRASIVRESGAIARVQANWSVDGPAEIGDDGRLVPTGTGVVTISADWEGVLTAATPLEIIGPGSVDLVIVDATTSQPIPAASILLDGEQAATDEQGRAAITGPFAGPVEITVWASGYRPVTVNGVVVRRVLLSLRPTSAVARGSFSGHVRFDEIRGGADPPTGHLYAALVGTAVRSSPLELRADGLLEEDRIVPTAGADILLPSNVYYQNGTPEFVATGPVGPVATFAYGGLVRLEAILEIAQDWPDLSAAERLTFMSRVIQESSYGRVDRDLSATSALRGADVSLRVSVSTPVTLSVPEIPVDDPSPLVFASADLAALGFLPLALIDIEAGGGELRVPPRELIAPDSRYHYTVVAEDPGQPSIRLSVTASDARPRRNVEFPEFLSVPADTAYAAIPSVPGVPGSLFVPSTDETDLVRQTVTATIGGFTYGWDVVAETEAAAIAWPLAGTGVGDPLVSGAEWTAQSLSLVSHTFQSLLVDGEDAGLDTDANRAVIYEGTVP